MSPERRGLAVEELLCKWEVVSHDWVVHYRWSLRESGQSFQHRSKSCGVIVFREHIWTLWAWELCTISDCPMHEWILSISHYITTLWMFIPGGKGECYSWTELTNYNSKEKVFLSTRKISNCNLLSQNKFFETIWLSSFNFLISFLVYKFFLF